jgi:tetratricopeptide (TPR) repeat protein
VEAVTRARALLVAVLALALGLRLWHLFSLRGDVLFEHPILDEQRYVQAALHGEDRPFWQPPGIIYVTAAVLRVCGPSLLWPRLLQALVGTAACLLLFLLGRRLFSERIGLVAAALLALHGVVIHAGGELLPAVWIAFLDLLILWFLVGERAFWAGLALGISALFSPVVLPFAAVAAAWLRRPRAVALLLLGVMLPIVPVTLRNQAHGGEWVPISTNGGLNLYIGNNENYRDTFALRPGRHWEELTTRPERLGLTQPGAQSSWFARRALAFMGAHPGRAAGLYLRKIYLYFNGAEIPRDTEVRIFGVWPPFPDGLVIPLALAGMFVCWRERRRLALLYGFVAAQALVTALFFVSARHRVPALPIFTLLAVVGAARLRRGWPIAAAGLVLLNLPVWEGAISLAGERDFYRGMAHARELHDPATAVEYLRRSDDARARFELGNALHELGRDDEAAQAWRAAAAADPWDSRARRRLATALMQRGDLEGAIEVVKAQVETRLREPAHYAPDWMNLAFLYVQKGRIEEARAAFRAAQAADPVWVAEHAQRLDAATRQALQGP